MTHPFDPTRGIIVVQAELFGPVGSTILSLALDTGATATMINVAPLATIGYDLSASADLVQVTTGSSVEYVRCIRVDRIKALGHMREGLPVLAHTLPTSATIDGLLGIDFMQGRKLIVDFDLAAVSLL